MFSHELLYMFMAMALSKSGRANQQENEGGQLMAKQTERLVPLKMMHLFVYF